MFSSEYRESVRRKIIEYSKSDARITSAAAVGSYARKCQDRWSDIDLTFGFDPVHSIDTMLKSWTEYVSNEYSGVPILDIKRGKTIYRVFVFPGCLQVDLSFTPQSDFGPAGPHFDLLFGTFNENTAIVSNTIDDSFGYMMHHLIRVRICIERKRLWQAEYWLNEARNYALKIACRARGLNTDHGRGFDDLPASLLEPLKASIIRELSSDELMKGLQCIVSILDDLSPEAKELYLRFKLHFDVLADSE